MSGRGERRKIEEREREIYRWITVGTKKKIL